MKNKQNIQNECNLSDERRMKNERILNTLGQVDEKYIAEAAPVQKAGNRFKWLKWSGVAACLALAVYMGMHLIPNKTQEAPSSGLSDQAQGGGSAGLSEQGGASSGLPDGSLEGDFAQLPLLTITGNGEEAMGYEGYMAYDISELINGNPWSEEAQLSTLPVYRNPLSYDANYIVSGADFEAMRAFLLEIAGRLGMDAETLIIGDNTISPEQQAVIIEKLEGDVPEGYFDPTEVIIEENGVKIAVDTAMVATITFEPAVTLPDRYNYTFYSSYEDIMDVAEYLKSTYSDLLGMERPQINVNGGDYNIYRQQMYHIGFYDAGESLTEEILNYHFRQVAFYCNDDGKLWMARIFNQDLSNKMGDYPIISQAEATELLLGGNYITTVPFEIPGQEYIAGAELVYRTGRHEEYYMPYYRFYVELPEMEREDGLKDYGAYYVPAVQSAYITEMPVWDGSFN